MFWPIFQFCSILANFGVAGLGYQILIIAISVGDNNHWFQDLFGRVGFDCLWSQKCIILLYHNNGFSDERSANLGESALAVYECDHNHNFSVDSKS